jgi:hypothetical protein
MVAITRKHKIIFSTIAAIVVASVATYIYLCHWREYFAPTGLEVCVHDRGLGADS